MSLDDDMDRKDNVTVQADGVTLPSHPVKDEDCKSPNGQLPNSRDMRLGSRNLTRSNSYQSPTKTTPAPQSPAIKTEHEDTVGGEVTVKMEPGQPPKLSRSSSKKIPLRPPPLFFDMPDSTAEAESTFDLLDSCTYANKYLGVTEHALECDCVEEWDAANNRNNACGEDSDCINRATKMECIGDCGCGSTCQNMRFQRKLYADVSVIRTQKKGYGLRANHDLLPNDFIFEYLGEVIGESAFRRRRQTYDEENIKHFYFMSLSKGEFIDATKKGNLGRFCNHSCNPNCYVDKWVVGDRLRMGIFAERKIAKGEELVFNYNVDRYGADPQPCYCEEPNCTGFIGGKTQTERATKLSTLTIEALGIEDGDDWDTAVAKRGRKKKSGEDDEEYVDSVQPKSLDESAVTKVMATLMQCKEKWIAVKLLNRIQRADDERVRNRVVKMHGYRILKTTLSNFVEDNNVVLQILEILHSLPRLTRNKIQDSKIEDTIEQLVKNEDERVSSQAQSILKIWSQLEVGYRIPRLKRDPAAIAAADKADREERRRAARDRSRSRSRHRSISPDAPKGPSNKAGSAPTGPKGGNAARSGFYGGARSGFRRGPPAPLPAGWFAHTNAEGRTYYYNANGTTTWEKPTAPAAPPPPPPKTVTNEQKLQEIIESITRSGPALREKPSATSTPTKLGAQEPVEKKERLEKWRTMSEEGRMKLYEKTIHSPVVHVMSKYKGKLEKEELKRFAKEIAKKLVASDFKNKRVDDPTQISRKQEAQIKKAVKAFFDKAVAKKTERDRLRAEKKKRESGPGPDAAPAAVNGESTTPTTPLVGAAAAELPSTGTEEEVVLSDNDVEDDEDDDDDDGSTPTGDMKRKREADETPLTGASPEDDEGGPTKKVRAATPPPPPPPPPPPAGFSEDQEQDMELQTPVEASTNDLMDSERERMVGVEQAS